MNAKDKGAIARALKQHHDELLSQWMRELLAAPGRRAELMKEAELQSQCRELLSLLGDAVERDGASDIQGSAWKPVRDFLGDISRSRVQQGYTPSQTATFVFSLKRPLFSALAADLSKDGQALADATWAATELIDRLGLHTTEIHQQSREQIIHRQQQDMLELSTPVVKLWEGVLALPMIGTLDSARTQVVMETLLQRIVETGAEIAIIDITGVPTVDTLVAQHLIKTVTAARLMGADCIISGIRPQIAQTIVHLGVTLTDIQTKASLADAFAVAIRRLGFGVTKL